MHSKFAIFIFSLALGCLNSLSAQVMHFTAPSSHTNQYNSLYIGPYAPNGYDNSGDIISYELEVDGRPVYDGHSGAIRARTEATGPSAIGTTEGFLASCSPFNSAGSLIGARGLSTPQLLDITVSGRNSSALGGYFAADMSNGLQFGATGLGKYYVGGSMSVITGTPAGYSPDGILAGVIGIDALKNSNTWGAYIEGRGFFDNKVGIGTKNMPTSIGISNTANYNLFVKGGILTDEVLVRTGWADYVFAPGYTLKPLEEVERHIQTEGHLPCTPTAATVEESGLNLGQAAVMQQEKIEELFLYVIQLNKDVQALKTENQALKNQLNALNATTDEN